MSTVTMIGLLTIQNFGTAMADVVIDAMIAEAARKERFSEYVPLIFLGFVIFHAYCVVHRRHGRHRGGLCVFITRYL
jgi:hypothetical protein